MGQAELREVRARPASSKERGQTLIILVFALIGLLAVVGIVTDAAIVYVHYDHLKRAVDAAAVSAVNQYRENRVAQQVHSSALQTLQLQLPGVQNVRIYWCVENDNVGYDDGTTSYDPTLCSTPPRKRIRVEADLPVTLAFLRLVWGNQVILHSSSEAEAAVLNMVLLIDTSESMAYQTCPPSLPEDDFFACLENCRGSGTCQPMESVRDAARGFVATLMRSDVDRVAVYHLDKVPVRNQSVEIYRCPEEPITSTWTFPVVLAPESGVVVPLTSNKQAVLDAIERGRTTPSDPLNIYIRPVARDPETGQSCQWLTHVGGAWGQVDVGGSHWAPGYGYRWASTNIGGGLAESISELVNNGSRDAAIWVIVLLSDGAANATDQASDANGWWTCPSPTTSGGPDYRNQQNGPFCRDPESDGVVTRHCPSQEVCDRQDPWYTNPDFVYDEWRYDADDYARDIADLASSQQIAIYTIGFGPYVISESRGRPDAGERLLRYIADVGDDGDLRTAPCGSNYYWAGGTPPPIGESCGNYYFAPDATQLQTTFESIASRIFSRITQ